MRCDRIWRNARLATMVGRHGLGLVDDGLIACGGGKILFAGPESAAPRDLEAPEAIDCRGRLITPGSTGSSPSASAGAPSVTRLIHSSCVARSGNTTTPDSAERPRACANTTPRNMVMTSPMFEESR